MLDRLLKDDYSRENIEKNIEKIIEYLNNLFKHDDNSVHILDDSKMIYVFDILVKIIYGKVENGLDINCEEAKLLLSILFLETAKCLGIDMSCLEMLKFASTDGKMLREKTTEGSCYMNPQTGKFEVYINEIYLSELCNKENNSMIRDKLLVVTAHELVHAKQKIDEITGVLTLSNFLMSLEIVFDIYTNYKYRYENYQYLRSEIEANSIGIKLYSTFLVTHQFMDREYYEAYSSVKEMADNQILGDAINRKMVVDGIEQECFFGPYILKMASEAVSSNQSLLVFFPILKLIYKNNGETYSVEELFKHRLSRKNNDNIDAINEIYEFIFNSYFRDKDAHIKLNEIKLYLQNNPEDEFANAILSNSKNTQIEQEMSMEELYLKMQKELTKKLTPPKL